MRKSNKKLLALSLGATLTSQNMMIIANAEKSSEVLDSELNILLNNESKTDLEEINSSEYELSTSSMVDEYQPDPEENQTYSMGGYSSKSNSTDLSLATLSNKAIGSGLVTTDNLNVRSGPSTSNDIIGTLNLDDTVEVIGTSGSWYKIDFNGQTGYISATYLSLNPIEKGIDVSKWNGDIDWKKVKADGIDYVIIRAGYGNSTVDPYFKTYIEGARDAGLKIGVYWFSYATSVERAKIEAQKCLETIAPYKNSISYPVFFDYEYDSVSYAAKQGITITKDLATEMSNAFLDAVESAGYVSGLYTNKDFGNRYFSNDLIYSSNLWVAQYSSTNSFNKPYSMWQYSEKGVVDGIKGNVDMNYTCLETFDLGINNGSNNGSDNDSNNAPVAPPATSAEKGVTTANLNLRAEASATSSVITTIPKGTNVEILDKSNNDWYKVSYNGQTGYASSKYITLDNNAPVAPPATSAEKGVTTANLNMRTSASTSASVITTIPKGTSVEVVDKSNSDWYKVNYNGQTGYVSSKYITLGNNNSSDNNNTTTTPPATATENGVTTANLNMRTSASTSASIITTIAKGSTVEIVDKSNPNWYKVKYNGQTGYVSREYVSVNGSTSTTKKYGTATANLNFRKTASTSGLIMSTIKKGSKVEILSNLNNGWYKVKYNGITGYVSSQYIQV